MSSRNKLARKRQRGTLNESAEDFKEESNSKKCTVVESQSDKTQTTKINSEEGAALHPCPLCGKTFRSGQFTARGSHLKTCGASRGMTTEQLIQIKQLEEKQAEERRALGLPERPIVKTDDEKKKKKTNTTVKKKTNAIEETSSDPHLEMALALSASLAQSKTPTLCEKPSTSFDPPLPLIAPPPASSVTFKANSKSKAKTTLQVRTDEERERQISERVALILGEENEESRVTMTEGQRGRVQSLFLCSAQDTNSALWKMAGDDGKNNSFHCDIIRPYLPPKDGGESKSLMQESIQMPEAKVREKVTKIMTTDKHLNALSNDWEVLLESGFKSDLTIHSKEGREIKCHSLVIYARCKNMLDDIMTESGPNGENTSILSWPTMSESAVKIVLKYLYTGQFTEIFKTSDYESINNMCEEYRLSDLSELLRENVKIDLLVPEEEEEEWENLNEEHDKKVDAMKQKDSVQYVESMSMVEKDEKEEILEVTTKSSRKSSFAEKQNHSRKEESTNSRKSRGSEETKNSICHKSSKYEIEPEKSKHDDDVHIVSDEDLFDEEDDVKLAPVSEMDELPSLNKSPDRMLETEVSLTGDANHVQDDVWDDFECAQEFQCFTPPDAGDELPQTSPHSLVNSATKTSICSKASSPVAKKGPICSTPTKNGETSTTKSSNTPLPDYESMLTPSLRRELRRFGLKAIPRRKAIPLLKHIYEETHKHVVAEVRSEIEDEIPQTQSSQESNELSQSFSSQNSDENECVEESMFAEREEEIQATQSDKVEKLTGIQLAQRVKEYIKKDRTLYTKVLRYEPIWLEEFHATFKSSERVKCTLNELIDVFDAECVTFRTEASSKRRKTKARSPKKKRKKTQK